MKSLFLFVKSPIIPLTVIWVLATAVSGCEKESPLEANRRRFPIPTELPAVTCEGANTVGAYVDSILFVANYYPNFSSWGSATPTDGISAFFEYPSSGPSYIEVFSLHPLRPDAIDTRRMNSHISYYPIEDSIGIVLFGYVGHGMDISLTTRGVTQDLSHDLHFNTVDSILCGTISRLTLIETSSVDIGDPEAYDTLVLRDYRLDVKVRRRRY